MPAARDDTHFGRRTVPLQDKQGLVDDVFHKVAGRYDVMNDLMSFGLHRAWKDALVARVRPSLTRPFAHVDVAGGTGDVALRVADAGGPLTTVTLVDVNPDMLGVAEERAAKRSFSSRLTFVEANAESLPLPDVRFDAYTIAFGIRNVPRIEAALSRSLSGAQARRAFPVPRILARRFAGARANSTTPIRSPRSRPWARS